MKTIKGILREMENPFSIHALQLFTSERRYFSSHKFRLTVWAKL
jgi:hypothetical protein